MPSINDHLLTLLNFLNLFVNLLLCDFLSIFVSITIIIRWLSWIYGIGEVSHPSSSPTSNYHLLLHIHFKMPSTAARLFSTAIVASSALLATAQSTIPLAAKSFSYVSCLAVRAVPECSTDSIFTITFAFFSLFPPCLWSLFYPSILQPDGIPYRVDNDDGPRGIQTGINVSSSPALHHVSTIITPVLVLRLEWRCTLLSLSIAKRVMAWINCWPCPSLYCPCLLENA